MIDREWALDVRAAMAAGLERGVSFEEVIRGSVAIADALMAVRKERGGFEDSPEVMLDKLVAMKPAVMKEIQTFLAELETMRDPRPLS